MNAASEGEAPPFLRWRIGDVTITKVVEVESTGGTKFILPEATRDAALAIPWLYPHFMDEHGRLRMSIHSLVVETAGRRILVDTCLGNDKPRSIASWSHRQGTFLRDLQRAGFDPSSIDVVVCTHLHVDHVGWNTMLVEGRWVPTFPRARYLMGRVEYAYWRGAQHGHDQQAVMADSVQPIFERGLVDLVETDHVIDPAVRLVPTLGHTPGHVSVRISSRGEEALITGDFIHHPCQLARPEWASSADEDAAQSSRTRRAVFEAMAGQPTLLIGTHFASPTAGRVVRDGDAWRIES